MCLIAFAWQAHPSLDLLIAANRDEFHARATRAAHWWDDPAGLFAGQDLQAGGAWCGMARDGRFAAVTNVREPTATVGHRSRGTLVRDYFTAPGSAAAWAEWVEAHGRNFSPFNLLVGDARALWFVSNRGPVRRLALRPGVHALSNGHWGEHWPKTERAQRALHERLSEERVDDGALFELLADARPAPTAALPDTGVGLERERFLSPVFIQGDTYGTRASTVILRRGDGRVAFHERSFDHTALERHRVDEQWQIARELRA